MARGRRRKDGGISSRTGGEIDEGLTEGFQSENATSRGQGHKRGPGDDCRAMDWRVWTSSHHRTGGVPRAHCSHLPSTRVHDSCPSPTAVYGSTASAEAVYDRTDSPQAMCMVAQRLRRLCMIVQTLRRPCMVAQCLRRLGYVVLSLPTACAPPPSSLPVVRGHLDHGSASCAVRGFDSFCLRRHDVLTDG